MENEQNIEIRINNNIKTKDNTFDYVLFFTANNQFQYFKQYMFDLVKDKDSNLRYFLIKIEMRNLDWDFISKSGLLQKDFILGVISVDQLSQKEIIPSISKNTYLPIKIFHYLIPDLLCKNNNLSEICSVIINDSSSGSSDSSSSYDSSSGYSDSSSSYDIVFYEKYIDFLNQDKESFFNDQIRLLESRNYYPNTVLRYDFLENQISSNYDNACAYSLRIYDQLDPYSEKSLSYYTNEKKYIGNVDIHYKTYTIDENYHQTEIDNVETKQYISNHQRRIGLDKTQLLKNQNISFDFAIKYYTMDQLCKYFKFTENILKLFPYGLYLSNSETIVPYNFEYLFKFQTFDTNNEDFKQFYNTIKSNLSTIAKYNLGLYQQISDTQFYNEITIKNKGVCQDREESLFPYTKSFLNINNEWFTSVSFLFNYNSIRTNISGEDPYIEDITQIENFIYKKTDNIIITNVSQLNKIEMIKKIAQPRGFENNIQHNNVYPSSYPSDANGSYLNLYIPKYDSNYIGMQNDTSVFTKYHTPYYFQNGLNICDKPYTKNKKYFIVGTLPLLFFNNNCSSENCLSVKVYFKDIIAILDNKCLATRKIYV